MKLLFTIKAMGNPGGGAERVLSDIVNGLVKRDHEVHLLTFEKEATPSFYSLDDRVVRHYLNSGDTKNKANFVDTLVRIKKLRRFVNRHQPDAIVGFMHSMYIPLGLALIGKKIPLIASDHIVPAHYKSRYLESLLLMLTPFLVNKITCVSSQVLKAYSTWLQSKMVVVPNPVVVCSNREANVLGSDVERKILLSVGRLEPQKDYLVLLEAFAKLASKHRDWDLHIAGSGSLRAKLERKIIELGLQERVSLLGTVLNIDKLYLESQLYVQPSKYESFGLTVAEALSFKLPCIGFDDCLGINSLIQTNKTGFLVHDNGDRVLALSQALSSLMTDELLREQFSKNIDLSLMEHNIDNVLAVWEQLIFKLKSAFNREGNY